MEKKLSYSDHDRLSKQKKLIYPVLSRRSKGLSIGVNLNPDKACTFDCVYCQVDRTQVPIKISPSLEQIEKELVDWLVLLETKDSEYQGYKLKDISIAGDGEPTSESILPEVISLLIELREKFKLSCKLNLFSNGTGILRPDLKKIIKKFYENGGEVWFKLDFWDEKSYQQINRSKALYKKILNNLLKHSQNYPVTLQSLFFKWDDKPFNQNDIVKYSKLVNELKENGAIISRVQAYTLARAPTEVEALPWTDNVMDEIGIILRKHINFPVEIYYEKGQAT